MKLLAAIAFGGAIGAVARYLFSTQVMRLTGDGFPWGIFCVNILGSFLMGLLAYKLSQAPDTDPIFRAFLTVGILGAFTTFSTFSLDIFYMIERGDFLAAGAYITGSVILSVVGLFGGMTLMRAAFG